MRSIFILSALFISACYSPRLSSGSFRCAEDGRCPAGFVCSKDRLCVDPAEADKPGPETDGGGPGPGADLIGPPPPDLTSGGMDLMGQMPPDMVQPAPCTMGPGTAVGMAGKSVYACPGKFDAGGAGALCGPQYQVCENGGMVDEAACNALSGFFAIRASLSLNYMNAMIKDEFCNNSMMGSVKALVGCGAVATPRLKMACQGLRTQIACNPTTIGGLSGWSCMTGFADAVNSNPTHGVLCCAN